MLHCNSASLPQEDLSDLEGSEQGLGLEAAPANCP